MVLKKENKIEKSNILNEMRCCGMNLQEVRFLGIYLSKINAREKNSRVVHFPLADFQKIMELGRLNHNNLQENTEKLLQKVVSLRTERGGYNQFQLFKECRVDINDDGDWFIEIDAHDKALPYFFEFKKENPYFTYELWNTLRLSSTNQIRMYELLKQHQKQGEYTYSVKEIRDLLFIEDNQYPRFGDFKTWVINKAQKELFERTDICFNYELIKKGAKVIAIKFFIRENKNYIDQLTLAEFIDMLPESKTIYEPDYSKTINEPVLDQEAADQANYFENENLEFLSEACNGEFDEKQMDIIKSYLVKLVPFESKTYQNDQYDYLMSKYKELNYRAKRQDLTPIKSRFAYLKSLFEIEIKNMGAEDETKW